MSWKKQVDFSTGSR